MQICELIAIFLYMFVIPNYTSNNACIIVEPELTYKWLFAGAQHLTQAVTWCFELPPCSEWTWQLQSSGTVEVREITAAEEQIEHLKKTLPFISATNEKYSDAQRTPQFLIKKNMNILGLPASLYTFPFTL